ncbi:MAG TPA: excinuclease ABC subunit A, partial [Thermodesulfovibrionia bacterium]|nr:excinuclease ABC subunit A [Thermodesulfovibrionia bacterium]
MSTNQLIIEGARQNNLKNVSLSLPHNALVVVTGVSGSGKSSLAFDTIYAEGQWRFIESLSPYSRLYIEKLARPDVDDIKNLRPAIALEQRNTVKTSRSTVGTITEVYDYLRLLVAKIGRPYCQGCGSELRRWAPSSVVQHLTTNFQGERALIVFLSEESAESLQGKGFHRFKEHEGRSGLLEVILDRLVIRDDSRLSDSIEMAWTEGKGKVIVDIVGKEKLVFSSGLFCHSCNLEVAEPHPLLFSFNHQVGVCPACKGFGDILQYTEDKVIAEPNLSLRQHAVMPLSKPSYEWWYEQMIKGAQKFGIDVDVPYKELSEQDKQTIFEGCQAFLGINDFFESLEDKKYKLHVRVFLSKYRQAVPCKACKGTRLRSEALAFQVAGRTIHDLSGMTLTRLFDFFETLTLSKYEATVAEEALRQLRLKLTFLNRVGLGYLTGDRPAKTLSGGEAQRIKLSNQLASKLTGTLYVLDEPTIGLHPADVSTIVSIMKELARIGNTLVVVEHDNTVIQAADWVVEIGPESGSRGGSIVFSGPYSSFIRQDSLTARYMLNIESIATKSTRRKGHAMLQVRGASGHNLKCIDVDFPLGTLICVTGVSGSGKSTLVNDTVFRFLAEKLHGLPESHAACKAVYGIERLRGVQIIDQSPVAKTPRSNPVT